ncbi:CDP-glycerol glycerophosphotransferase family protein [Sanguibacter sp. HDW7]|uniref:CDP-glycerol glycerophosphotransferase family protein n=1 Tax=Sanguibacter sp. HDW7 TaxID=2714931 RepID=UPI0014097FA7|nr:CDP-glycerol glycerophosphotransferase family protein [Sanguibacter sp. HDW7]QIK82873.1 hypothetical protein G7063_03960 [Sanguibacter sp. HDW7]
MTDYSSVMFGGAAIRRPVVCFQLDRDEMIGGGHTTRPGCFDYAQDGFGPVARSVDAVVDDILDVVDAGGDLAEPYAIRVEATLDRLDGENCARTVTAIKAVEKKVRWV